MEGAAAMTDTLPILKGLIAKTLGIPQHELVAGDVVECRDRLERIELAMAAEDEFEVEIADTELAGLTTVADWAALIDSKRAGQC